MCTVEQEQLEAEETDYVRARNMVQCLQSLIANLMNAAGLLERFA